LVLILAMGVSYLLIRVRLEEREWKRTKKAKNDLI
jgi:hypothetical protein